MNGEIDIYYSLNGKFTKLNRIANDKCHLKKIPAIWKKGFPICGINNYAKV